MATEQRDWQFGESNKASAGRNSNLWKTLPKHEPFAYLGAVFSAEVALGVRLPRGDVMKN